MLCECGGNWTEHQIDVPVRLDRTCQLHSLPIIRHHCVIILITTRAIGVRCATDRQEAPRRVELFLKRLAHAMLASVGAIQIACVGTSSLIQLVHLIMSVLMLLIINKEEHWFGVPITPRQVPGPRKGIHRMTDTSRTK